MIARLRRLANLSNGGAERAEAVTRSAKGWRRPPARYADPHSVAASRRQLTLAQAALAAFGNAIKIEEETHGFRWVEERDLGGFIDGTENPQGEQRPAVATIAEGEDRRQLRAGAAL